MAAIYFLIFYLCGSLMNLKMPAEGKYWLKTICVWVCLGRIMIGFSCHPGYRHIWVFLSKEIENYPDFQKNFEHRLYHREEFLTDPSWFMAPVIVSVYDRSLAPCVQKIVSQQVFLPGIWQKGLFVCLCVCFEHFMTGEYSVDRMPQRELIFKDQRNVFSLT